MDDQLPTAADASRATPRKNGAFPSEADFINYLDQEISSYRSDLTRPGWTTWALVGAIAAASWLLLEQAEKSGFAFRNVLFVLLVVSLFLDAGTHLATLISGSTIKDSRPSKYRLASGLLGQNRVGLILLSIR